MNKSVLLLLFACSLFVPACRDDGSESGCDATIEVPTLGHSLPPCPPKPQPPPPCDHAHGHGCD